VEFRILGPLEAVEDGNPVALGTLKERLVLGVLLLHPNEFVSRERLIDDLWGDAPPPTAHKAVNVYLSKVRKALSIAGADPITTASGGYRLHVEPEELDAGRMQVLAAEARERVAQGEPKIAADRFREALSLWRGPTLAGLQLESRGRDEIAQLDEFRLTMLMDRIDCDLAQGHHELVLGELSVLVREHPLKERLRAQQMLALYRADRQADALDAYRQARQSLVDDLGIEPGEALQRLQKGILAHDPVLETPTGIGARNGSSSQPHPAPDTLEPTATTQPPTTRARRTQFAEVAANVEPFSAVFRDTICGRKLCGTGDVDRYGAATSITEFSEVIAGPQPGGETYKGTRIVTLDESKDSTLRLAIEGPAVGARAWGTFQIVSGTGAFAKASGNGVIWGEPLLVHYYGVIRFEP
jgi:DNA-binding SARP family transcriptional activator